MGDAATGARRIPRRAWTAVLGKTVEGNVVGADDPGDRSAAATGGAEAEVCRVWIGLGAARLSRAEAGKPFRRSGGNGDAGDAGAGGEAGSRDPDECGRGRRVRIGAVSHTGSLFRGFRK